MKIIDLLVNHDKRQVEVHIKRINPNTGAYSTKRYQVKKTRFAGALPKLLQTLPTKYVKDLDGRYRVRHYFR